MKSTILNLNKRVLVVEFEIGQTMGDALDKLNLKLDLDIICKGSELSEEIAKGLILLNEKTGLYDGYYSPMVAFISAIEAPNYYWIENPIPFIEYEAFVLSEEKYNEYMKNHFEAESKTFKPEQCLIFEIL